MSDQDLVKLFRLDRLPVARPGRYMFCAFIKGDFKATDDHITLITWSGRTITLSVNSINSDDTYVWNIPMSAAHCEGLI